MEQINPYEAFTQSKEGSFSDEALQDNASLMAESEAKIDQEQAQLEEVAEGPSATAMDAEQQIEQVHQQEEKETQDGLTKYVDTIQDVGQNVLEFADTAKEFGQSPAAGTVDFAIDAFNLTPAKIPKLPKFKNDIAQGFRDISSVIIPTFILSRLGIRGGAMAQQKVGWAIGKDPLVRMISVMGLEAGIGAGVDYTSSTSQEGNNLSGQLRESMPELFWWIPDDIATLSDDDPDVKRDKSVKEGVMLGPFTDLLVGAARIARGIKGTHKIRGQFLPENEIADKNWAKQATDSAEDSGEDMVRIYEEAAESVNNSAQARQDVLSELGNYNSSKDASLDQPMLGRDDDMFEATEQGIRSVDPNGVHGAAVDAARIKKNKNTVYGRMGSIVTESALKHGLDGDSITKRTFIKMIKETLAAGGKYSYKDVANNLTTSKEIKEAGEALAGVLVDPRMDVQMMKAMLEDSKNVMEGIQVLDKAGTQGVFRALKHYIDEYFNLDTLKAQAYLTHSLAGQASDMAEGARLMKGTDAVSRAQEQIFDRILYLTAEKGLAGKMGGSYLQNQNLWQQLRNMKPSAAKEAVEGMTEDVEDYVSAVVEKTRNFRTTMTNIRESRPEFLEPLMTLYELTDGNVDSMYKLNNWVGNKLGTIDKAFIDGQTHIPSEVIKGAYGNLYNSLLSSLSTVNKAAFGNAALLIEKPIATAIGGMAARDMKVLRRAWYQYSALGDSLLKGMSHLGMVFSKASRNPDSVPYIVRDDIATKNIEEMRALGMAAKSYADNDEMGPQIMFNVAEGLFDLQNHPVLRWGTNGLSALDGFNRAVIANSEARGKAFDELLETGEKINGKSMRKAADRHYQMMFDSDGFVKDTAVEYMTRETTFSLDNKASNALNGLVQMMPALKPWILFSRTPMNMLSATWNRSLTSVFAGDYNKIVGLPGKVHSVEEIKGILRDRGIPDDKHALQRFRQLQAEIKGRVALGQTAVAAGMYLFMQDRVTGNGLYDKEKQRTRRDGTWQARSIKGLDGKWYSYGEIGPLADWLSATVDVMDNFDMLSSHAFEDFGRKIGFVFAATVTERTTLAALQPLMDLLTGDEGKFQRWLATTGSGFFPLSGLRGEIGRLLYPELAVFDREFGDHLRNRNKWMNTIDPDGALPTRTDWVDGTTIGEPGNFFERIMNASFPVKVGKQPSKYRQFLMDIEYDGHPTFAKSKGGVVLNNKQRAELWSLVGKNPYFRGQLDEIMKDAKEIDFVGKLRKARRSFKGQDVVKIEDFGSIYSRINKALRDAKEAAENDLPEIDDIREQEAVLEEVQMQNQYGIIENK